MRIVGLPKASSLVAALAMTYLLGACGSGRSGRGSELAGEVRAEIEAQIARTVDATRRQDIETYMKTFTPDFEESATDGDQGKLADLRAHALRDWAIIPATRDLWARIDSMGEVAGDTVVVYTNQRWERLMLERDLVTRDTVITTQKHREVWRRTGLGWRLSRVTELGGSIVVNGKPYVE
jgi:hypothetical protein